MGTGLFKEAADNLQFLLVCAVVIAAIIALSKGFEMTLLKKNMTVVSRTNYITICAMFGAIALVLYLFDFPIVIIAPSFYKLDFSEIPVMIGAFYLGPVGGVIMELVKALLKIVIKGTDTAFVGDLANFVIGCSFVVPASIIYHIKKSRKYAVAGLVTGGAVLVLFGTFFNAFYLLPAFANLYGIPLDSIIAMGNAINSAVNGVTAFVILCVGPLNLIKAVCISVPTMLLYKRISVVLHSIGQGQSVSGSKKQNRKNKGAENGNN